MSLRREGAFPALLDLDDREFELLSELIRERSGIHLGPHKRTLVRARLGKRLRALGLPSFQSYYELLTEGDPDGSELVLMLDAISTNVTHFFREAAHFEHLKSEIFKAGDGPLRILSAGCSTGEEPYSIAISAFEALGPAAAAARVRVTAFDLSTRALGVARAGVYALDRASGLGPERLKLAFLKGSGSSEGLVKIAPEVQALVRFERRNLVDPLDFPEPFHAIFCRNVVIYFARPTQKRLFGRFFELLEPGGTLFVGHSESMVCSGNDFEYVRPTVYRRPG